MITIQGLSTFAKDIGVALAIAALIAAALLIGPLIQGIKMFERHG